jgi:hypothetical protein
MDKALESSNGVRLIQGTADSLLFVKVDNGSSTSPITFDYFFSNSLRFISVKSNDVNANVHTRLRREGKIHSTLDEAYLKRLGDEVEVLR